MMKKVPVTSSGSCGLWEGERGANSNWTLEVNEEYDEAFRTKSYQDILSKVQEQMNEGCSDHSGEDMWSCFSLPGGSLPFYVHFADFLSEPRRQTVEELIERLNCHHLIGDYFEASLEACDLCDLLLQGIHQMRCDHRKFKNVIRLSKMLQVKGDVSHKLWETVYRELATCALNRNQVSLGEKQLRDVHISNLGLLDRLTKETRRVSKRVKVNRICEKIGGSCLVISYIALATIAVHGLMGCNWNDNGYLLPKRSTMLEKLGVQLDLATRGTYILINDVDTIGMLVRRLEGEIDHWRALAGMCVKNKRSDLLREVVMEFDHRDLSYEEELVELERHVYLCFKTIDKSRRSVMQEIKAVAIE